MSAEHSGSVCFGRLSQTQATHVHALPQTESHMHVLQLEKCMMLAAQFAARSLVQLLCAALFVQPVESVAQSESQICGLEVCW